MPSELFPGLRPEHGCRRGALTVWLAEPFTMVTQVAPGSNVTTEMLDVVVGAATAALLERLAAAEAGSKATFVHDWRGVARYEPGTRQALIAWGLRLGRSTVGRIDVLLGPSASAILKMGVAAGEAVFSAIGIGFHVHHSEIAFRAELRTEALRSIALSVPKRTSVRPSPVR